MKRKILLFILPLALIAIILSCKKGSIETNYNPSLNVANNQAIAERAYADVFNIFFRVISDSTLRQQGTNNIFGAECTYTETAGIQYIIDFKANYSPCPDGKARKGMITATLDQKIYNPGAIATLKFADYTVDDLKLQGDNTISNDSLSMAMQQMYKHEIAAATLTFIDSTSHTNYYWGSNKTFTHTEGMGTVDDFSDDLFEITGQSTGADIYGTTFSTLIQEPLGDYFNCRWIRTGITLLNIPYTDVPSGYIDYIGEDTCTNQVLYYLNGNPFYDEFDRY